MRLHGCPFVAVIQLIDTGVESSSLSPGSASRWLTIVASARNVILPRALSSLVTVYVNANRVVWPASLTGTDSVSDPVVRKPPGTLLARSTSTVSG
jgi:hypothetical protein